MNILGGSPLGLINVYSTANANGDSTFNGGGSRKINVNNYNKATSEKYPIQDIGNYSFIAQDINVDYGTRSLFNQSVVAPYGGISDTTKKAIDRKQLHNNNIYDTSLLNIIEVLSKTMGALRPSEFAYLKDVGVYPNNRLMIARRFASPIGDNIFNKPKSKLGTIATLISWNPQDDDFLEISFGEKWEDAKADFTEVLNSLGKDFTMSGGLSPGNMGAAALGGIPLPGFTEVLQRQVLTSLGILNKDDGQDAPLPSGNPNLIKEAKRRKTITFSEPGSGLKCSVSIKMTCVWEQKFISGIDPTIVFQDILSMITRFATSNSDTYGFSLKGNEKIENWVNHPEQIVDDLVSAITGSLTEVVDSMKKAIKIDINNTRNGKTEVSGDNKSILDGYNQIAVLDNIKNTAGDVLKKSIQKYKIEIEGIGRALSGAPSTPWHVTLGNPMRPVFCAGDMYMDSEINLKLGPTLAFNDLPSTITAEFTLVNARAWGMQEILAKFNAGSIRVSNGIKDYNSLNGNEKSGDDTNKPSGASASASSSNKNNASSGAASPTKKAIERPKIESTVSQLQPVGPQAINTDFDNKGNFPTAFSQPMEFKPIASTPVSNVTTPFSTKYGLQGIESINPDASSIFPTQMLKNN